MTPEHQEQVLVSLGILVLLSMFVERALAFWFEWRWLERKLWCRGDMKPGVALVVSVAACALFQFNVFEALFPNVRRGPWFWGFGVTLTGLVVAGGSAGAIKLFQGVLGFNKVARDAMRDARVAKAREEKVRARARRLEAEALAVELEERKALAQARLKALDEGAKRPPGRDSPFAAAMARVPEPWEREARDDVREVRR